MRNYGHDERGVPASYSVHTQELYFPFFGRKMFARVGIGASSNSDVRFGFVFGGLGPVDLPASGCSLPSFCAIWILYGRRKDPTMLWCRLYQIHGRSETFGVAPNLLGRRSSSMSSLSKQGAWLRCLRIGCKTRLEALSSNMRRKCI